MGGEEFRKQTDYISIVFIHTESAHAGALVLVSLHLPSWAGEKRRGNAKTIGAGRKKSKCTQKRPGATRKYE